MAVLYCLRQIKPLRVLYSSRETGVYIKKAISKQEDSLFYR